MRTRLAIIAMLVLGFAFSGSGVGLAISGSPAGTSAQGQYGAPGSGVLGETGGGGKKHGSAPSGGGVAGETTQPARQQTVESGQGTPSQLPFTGFAAVPVLLLGLALVGGGFVLRHRTRLN